MVCTFGPGRSPAARRCSPSMPVLPWIPYSGQRCIRRHYRLLATLPRLLHLVVVPSTGKLWPRIYQIETAEVAREAAADALALARKQCIIHQ